MEKRIVVPIDYSDVSKDVALFADKWAVRTTGKLYFLHVSRLPQVSYYPGHFEHLDQRDENEDLYTLENFLGQFGLKSNFEFSHEYGSPYLKIVDLVESLEADLVIFQHTHIQCLAGCSWGATPIMSCIMFIVPFTSLKILLCRPTKLYWFLLISVKPIVLS